MQMIQPASPQVAGLPTPAPEAALAQLARAALGLVQSAGQPVPAQVIGALAGGLTQLQIGEMVLAVRLSSPLVAGTAVKLSISTDGKGQQGLQVTPVAAGTATASAQHGPVAPAALPSAAQSLVAAARAVTPQMAAPAPTAATIASPSPPASVPPPVATRTLPSAPAVATATMAGAPAGPTATALDSQEPARGGVRAPANARGSIAETAMPTVVATPPASPLATGVAPIVQGTKAVATTPTAAVAGPAATAAVDIADVPPAPNAGMPRTKAVAAGGVGAPAIAATTSPVVLGGASPTALPPTQLVPPQAPTQVVGQQPMVAGAAGNTAVVPAATASPPPAPAPTGPPQAAFAAGQATPVAVPQAGGAVAIPYRAVPSGSPQAPAPALPLAQILADPAQAAARQNSIVPLLARLAALGPQLNALPVPAAQAALRLLAMRLEAGGLDGRALQGAVATAGVLARPGAGTSPAAATLKSALLQLRGGLAGVPGAEIEAVTAVAGRPHPPVRGDEARTVRAELPLPMAGEEPARGLLSQADGALSRLKLLQHASQPPEARPGAQTQQELRVEVPLLIGTQTALLQLVVDREARRRERPGERGWRMRFAFASQQTGEVGAEVALFGPSVSVALWADSSEMEAAMVDGLDSLRAALAAEGLEAGSVRVRRRAIAPSQQPGALMDSAR